MRRFIAYPGFESPSFRHDAMLRRYPNFSCRVNLSQVPKTPNPVRCRFAWVAFALLLSTLTPPLSAAPCASTPCFAAPAALGIADGSNAANATTISEAMTSVPLSGAIVLSAGSYTLPAGVLATRGTLKVGSNTTISGAGKDVTVVQRASGATLANGIFLTNVSGAGGDIATAVDNVRIESLTLGLPGNDPAPTFATASAAGFSNAGIASQPNVNVNNFFAFGVGSNGHGSAGFSFASITTLLSGTTNQLTNFILDSVTANWNRQGGVGRGLWSTGQRRNWVISNSEFLDNALVGVDLNSGATRHVRMANNRVVGNTDSGMAMHEFDLIAPLADPVPLPTPLIDPRTGTDVTPTGVSFTGNTITDNGRFGIEAKGANGTASEPFVISNNTVSVSNGYRYRFSVLNKNSALGTTADALFGDCRDRAGIIVARLQTAVGDGNFPIEPAAAAPSGVTVTGNTVRNIRHPFNGIDATTVDLIPGGGLDARVACPTTPSISVDRDGFGLVLEGAGNSVRDNVILGNDIGLQLQVGNPNNSLAVGQNTATSPYFDRGTGTTLGVNTVTHNVICGNLDFEASRWVGGALAPYPLPGNYFGLSGAPAAKLRDVDQAGFITDPYQDAFISTNAPLCGPIPLLSLSKTNPAGGVSGGWVVNQAASYLLTISNAPAAATSAPTILVSEKLPPHFQFNAASPAAGASGVSCVQSGTLVAGLDLSCTLTTTAGIASGGSAAFTLNATALTAAGGVAVSNRARVSLLGQSASDATACTATGVPLGCALASAQPQSIADMFVPAPFLLPAGVVGQAYPPIALVCTNAGPNTATGARCGVSGLPTGLTANCLPGGGNPAVGQVLSANAGITCVISGTPSTALSATVALTTGSNEDIQPANNASSATLLISQGAPPVLVADAANTPADTALVQDVLANDNCPGTVANNACAPSTLSLTGNAANGACTIQTGAPPRVRFVPNTGFSGTGRCEYKVCSSTDPLACAVATLTIIVATPVAVPATHPAVLWSLFLLLGLVARKRVRIGKVD